MKQDSVYLNLDIVVWSVVHNERAGLIQISESGYEPLISKRDTGVSATIVGVKEQRVIRLFFDYNHAFLLLLVHRQGVLVFLRLLAGPGEHAPQSHYNESKHEHKGRFLVDHLQAHIFDVFRR